MGNSFYILNNILKMKHNNLKKISIIFQLLGIENAIHFQFTFFEIGFDVEKFSIKKSNWVTWVPYPYKDPTTILKFELQKSDQERKLQS